MNTSEKGSQVSQIEPFAIAWDTLHNPDHIAVQVAGSLFGDYSPCFDDTAMVTFTVLIAEHAKVFLGSSAGQPWKL